MTSRHLVREAFRPASNFLKAAVGADARLAVIPGSTLSDMHLSVSQWKADAGWPYRVMQFRVRGFG